MSVNAELLSFDSKHSSDGSHSDQISQQQVRFLMVWCGVIASRADKKFVGGMSSDCWPKERLGGVCEACSEVPYMTETHASLSDRRHLETTLFSVMIST